MEISVGMLVDYEGALARRVAGSVWSGLSRAALEEGAGCVKTTATWDGLDESSEAEVAEAAIRIFVLDQEYPEAIDALGRTSGGARLYGLVLAVPERPNPLAGSLLYQGVERLQESGIKPGYVEPALLRADTGECERYAGKLLDRLKVH